VLPPSRSALPARIRSSLPRLDKPGEVNIIPIKKGPRVVYDMIGYTRMSEHFPSLRKLGPLRWTRGRLLNLKAPVAHGGRRKTIRSRFQGPRICLGKKFAQVDAVAFLTSLLREHRVEPICRPGENTEACQRIEAVRGRYATLPRQDPVEACAKTTRCLVLSLRALCTYTLSLHVQVVNIVLQE